MINRCLTFFGLLTLFLGSSAREVDLGTTLLAVNYKDGVVVGADTRTSVGSYVSNRFAFKIAPILNRAVICRSGSAADTQNLVEEVRWTVQSRYYRYDTQISDVPTTTLSQIAHLLRNLIRESSSEVKASLICAGYEDGKGKIYSIAPSGLLLEEKRGYALSGSGSTFITGLVDQTYRPDMTQEEATNFVVQAIRRAIERDGSSGGFVRLYVLNREGSRELTVYPDRAVKLNKDGAITNRAGVSLHGFASPAFNK